MTKKARPITETTLGGKIAPPVPPEADGVTLLPVNLFLAIDPPKPSVLDGRVGSSLGVCYQADVVFQDEQGAIIGVTGLGPTSEAALQDLRDRVKPYFEHPTTTACCGSANVDGIRWNPTNGVVQCHSCGAIWAPRF